MKTPITYYGGKQTMLKHILPLIPKHNLYTEAFAGGAALFFAKEPAKVEVINDLNNELINFYRTIVSDFDALKLKVDETIHSRRLHEHAWYIYNQPAFFSATDRAWSVWVLSKMGFAGQISSSFGFDKSTGQKQRTIAFAKQNFNESLKVRLEHTTVERDDALRVIKRYDTADAFHFVDPPYVGSNMGHYSGMFNEENLKELLRLLVNIKGKFMLTMYPNSIIESFVKEHGWQIHAVNRTVTACKASARRKQEEWMIVNYTI
ncbi:MAG: DNA adenine methylase [Bacteroidales bacterium]